MKPAPTTARILWLATLATFAACSKADDSKPSTNPNLYEVTRADLPITVKENAELQAVHETVVRSGVEGQATIIYLIDEGTNVKPGDKLVELDVSDLVEKRETQEIAVAKADAALVQAKKALEILQKDLMAKLNTAESNKTIADLELKKFLGRSGAGKSASKNADMVRKLLDLVSPKSEPPEVTEGAAKAHDPVPPAKDSSLVTQVDPHHYAGLVDKVKEQLTDPVSGTSEIDNEMGDMANQILQQVDKIRLAMADLKLKEDTYQHSKSLAAKQFIMRNELDKDELAYQAQESAVSLAWNDLDLLINYTLAKNQIKLKQDFENTDLLLQSVIASNQNEETKANSDLLSKQKEYDLVKSRLDTLERQIRNAILLAPGPGTVVYARLDRGGRGSDAVKEGVQVRERQDLIILPDTMKMRAVIKVQEADIDKVARGQTVYVTVESHPNEVFPGHVTSVAPVADSNSGWMTSNRKVYTTLVELDGDNKDGTLRSRAAAAATIVVEELKNVLAVPLQAVRRDRSVNYVWKQTAEGPLAVELVVGRHSAEKVEILKGVANHDVLYLAQPLGVKEPRFVQPDMPAATPVSPIEPAALTAGVKPGGKAKPTEVAKADDGPGGASPEQGQGQKGGNRLPTPEMQKTLVDLKNWLKTKYPERAEEFDAPQGTLKAMREPAVLGALKSDKPELAEKLEEANQRMMQGGRNRPSGGDPNAPGRDTK